MEALKLFTGDLDKLCRICLDESKTLTDIYIVSAALNGTIVDALIKCAPLHITQDDGLPTFICDSCLGQLLKSRQFQVKAVDSEQILLRHLKKIQSEEAEEFYNDLEDFKSELSPNNKNFSNATNNLDSVKLIDDVKNENSMTHNVTQNLKKGTNRNTQPKNEIKREEITKRSSQKAFEMNCYYPEKRIKRHLSKNYSKTIEKRDKCSEINTTRKGPRQKKIHQCEFCNKCFAMKDTLIRHRRRHTGEKPFRCEVCNKRFSRMCILTVHKRTHTGETPHQCDVCGRCFSELGTLNVHKRKHTGEKPYQCDICSKCFTYKTSLDVHLQNHSGAKPHQCDVCNKTFSQKTNLTRHKRRHTGEKPYQCDVCYKWFSHKCALNRHKPKHTGVKPHQCDVCSKRFTELGTLKIHKRQHTGEKPYRCDVCNKCFTRKTYMNQHKRKHTGV